MQEEHIKYVVFLQIDIPLSGNFNTAIPSLHAARTWYLSFTPYKQ